MRRGRLCITEAREAQGLYGNPSVGGIAAVSVLAYSQPVLIGNLASSCLARATWEA